MLKLIVSGHDLKRLDEVKTELKAIQEEFKNLKIISSKLQYLETVMDSHLRLLVFDTRSINKNVFPFVVQIRKMGYTGPILVLGESSSSFDVSELATVKNLFHLNKPYTPEQLVGLANNCISMEQMRQRRDQRFSVREKAVLESYGSDLSIETIINNISRSGVRVEGELGGLKQGDVLRLHFNFDQIQKERTMSARVVWLKKDGDIVGEAGLEFVSQKAVYRYLLENAAA